MSDTTAPPPVVAEDAPRFSWPMRLFLFVLLFDIIFRSFQKRKRRQLFAHRTTDGLAQIRNRAPGKK